ncbi:molybdate ABC transporter substrate-binding protein [Aurantimonas sp. LRZ36]|uniref:Molybdate ABC transporter substrate-binding protein n=1 Tax=Aurantimonas marianensis TaxID=2920428 RepID=A0A9X2KGB4_9HYPH|nr:molybdate ABC transporter substrate-binding protein [Aurantimonas marianensis]MCP3056110.1 molybdate ABC transporter substrate-binding protein [Aurantimonas marianensis]
MRRWIRSLAVAGLLVALCAPSFADAATVRVAVAANFTEAAKAIAAAFAAKTGDTAELSFGSTGTLYTQISQNAPFEVFLAADDARPKKAVAEKLAVEGTVFTYAIGKIVLYSADPDRITGAETLKAGDFDRIAIANPMTAPYGAAAIAAMKALGVYDALEPKLVQGTNIAQTFQFVATGNAELGFVALAQVAGNESGSLWELPTDLHPPIRQDAVLLETGRDSQTAKAFLTFLKGPEAAAIIRRFGYDTGD